MQARMQNTDRRGELRALACFLLVFISILPGLSAQAAMREPSANRECATCHIMWLSEFKREDVETLIPYDPRPDVPSGRQDVSSTEAMCFSCHDGFVLDSRSSWQQGRHSHPVGKVPSDKIRIPLVEGKELLPLNDDGKIYCGSCHSAHGIDWEQKDTAVFMRVPNENGELCMACHQQKTEGAKHGSHPLQTKIQKLLHRPPENLMQAGARFSYDGELLCQSCHKAHGAKEDKLVLLENSNSELCGACHIKRYTETIGQAGENGTHPVNIKPFNTEISHRLLQQGAKLGSDGEIICQTCHRPHDATPETGLLVAENKKDSLCQDCHLKQGSISNTKHDMTVAAADSHNIRKQQAGESGACSACHVPHEGSGPKMWARHRDTKQDTMVSLCTSCHAKDGLAEKHSVGDYSHPVGVPVSKLQHSVPLPAFSDNGIKWVDVEKGKVSCSSCHDPHQWDPDDNRHIAQAGDDKHGDSTNSFLRIANDADMKLCRSCHEDKWKVSNSKHDMRKMSPQATNVLGETAEQAGVCSSCHLVHNAKGIHLWARDDLTGKDAMSTACLGCHNKSGLAKDKIIGHLSHPVDVPVTELDIRASSENWISEMPDPFDEENTLGGDPVPLPLYDSSGKRTNEGGRVGCGTCHDPHEWTQLAEHMADDPATTEGDSGNSFLRIADKSLSLLCVNCHVDKKAIFFSKHDLTEQEGKYSTRLEDDRDKTDQQHLSGPCMHCHRPHNANGPALWSRDKGEGETVIARLCTDCHQKEGLAADKLPGNHSHPVGKPVTTLQHDDRLPTFTEDGDRQKDGEGNVDCASCHDAHRWNPDDSSNRGLAMLAEDGDTTNSFLRLSANGNSDLCVSCHADKKTVIGTDHDLSHTADDAQNSLGQKQDVSGVCGQCHVPHNGVTDAYIWAQQSGEGDDPVERACNSCHNPTGYAAHKNPQLAKHPRQVKIWSNKIRQSIYPGKILPDTQVFDKDGKRTDFGNITCASCHDPHQWDAGKAVQGSGENIEGDARTSFLRARHSENIVCAECHGNDAIYRYKYFHSESTHKKHHMFK